VEFIFLLECRRRATVFQPGRPKQFTPIKSHAFTPKCIS
jgi:hypothetical protein